MFPSLIVFEDGVALCFVLSSWWYWNPGVGGTGRFPPLIVFKDGTELCFVLSPWGCWSPGVGDTGRLSVSGVVNAVLAPRSGWYRSGASVGS